jgi:hypothetical protein
MNFIYWLLDVTSNHVVLDFLDTHSVILGFLGGMFFIVAKYLAKKTPSPDDDELIAAIENKVGDLFHSTIQKRVNGG